MFPQPLEEALLRSLDSVLLRSRDRSAGADRLGQRPLEKEFAPAIRATPKRPRPRDRIDIRDDNARGPRKLTVNLPSGQFTDEAPPDRKRPSAARKTNAARLVETDPDGYDQLWGVANEPQIALFIAGSRLGRNRPFNNSFSPLCLFLMVTSVMSAASAKSLCV